MKLWHCISERSEVKMHCDIIKICKKALAVIKTVILEQQLDLQFNLHNVYLLSFSRAFICISCSSSASRAHVMMSFIQSCVWQSCEPRSNLSCEGLSFSLVSLSYPVMILPAVNLFTCCRISKCSGKTLNILSLYSLQLSERISKLSLSVLHSIPAFGGNQIV